MTDNPPRWELISLKLMQDWTLSLHVSVWIVVGLVILAVAILIAKLFLSGNWDNFEIDEAEIGVGNGKFTLKPNLTDRQVAYSIWVELSTRKIGLPIDYEHDVAIEVYDSWHSFFGVTRELIKSIPVNKVRNPSTQKIIQLSIEVLNEGLRPHLTMWQARFRRWYDHELSKRPDEVLVDPQDIQKKFPKWDELATDMERVNKNLIAYRAKMKNLVSKSMQ